MGMGRKMSRLFGRRPSSEKEVKYYFMENGALVLEGVITCFNGKHKIPVRSFTSHELVTATDNFSHPFTAWRQTYGGSFEQRPILVTKSADDALSLEMELQDEAIRDIVVTSQMSIHGNVLKLLGCCLEYPVPALVYEYPPGAQLLSSLLRGNNEDSPLLLTWRSRLKIANGIANVILYLHSAFTTPIIYRDIKPSHVMIDQNGVAKLFDFSESVSLPPGESQVEDSVRGTMGYLDPEYFRTCFVSEKTDVYSFGVLLLQLLTGKEALYYLPDNSKLRSVVEFAHNHEDQLDEIVDVKLSGEGGGIEERQQLQSFLSLALACTKDMGGDRPEMLDVARELHQIMRSSMSPN